MPDTNGIPNPNDLQNTASQASEKTMMIVDAAVNAVSTKIDDSVKYSGFNSQYQAPSERKGQRGNSQNTNQGGGDRYGRNQVGGSKDNRISTGGNPAQPQNFSTGGGAPSNAATQKQMGANSSLFGGGDKSYSAIVDRSDIHAKSGNMAVPKGGKYNQTTANGDGIQAGKVQRNRFAVNNSGSMNNTSLDGRKVSVSTSRNVAPKASVTGVLPKASSRPPKPVSTHITVNGSSASPKEVYGAANKSVGNAVDRSKYGIANTVASIEQENGGSPAAEGWYNTRKNVDARKPYEITKDYTVKQYDESEERRGYNEMDRKAQLYRYHITRI